MVAFLRRVSVFFLLPYIGDLLGVNCVANLLQVGIDEVIALPSRNICLGALLQKLGWPWLFRDCWVCLLEISIERADLFK